MTFIHFALIALLVVSNASAQVVSSAAAQDDTRTAATRNASVTPTPVVIPLELLANRPLVRVTVNGQGPFAFLIAPEDRQTRIAPELAEALKLRSEKNVELTVELGWGGNEPAIPGVPQNSAQTVKVSVSIEDISGVTPEFTAAMRPRGIISLSAWNDHLVTLDYSKWRVSIEPGALPEPDSKDVFALDASGELHMVLSIGEHAIECHVDPLFPGNIVLPASSLTTLQLLGDPRDVGTFRTREGNFRVREGRLATDASVGPFTVKTPFVLLADRATTATVGTPWLSHYAVTYDLSRGRVRLEKPASPQARQ